MTVTVIIPTYKPDDIFRRMVKSIDMQKYPIEKIIIMNTEKKYWKDAFLNGIEHTEVHHISKEEFDHGKTRAAGAAMATTDLVLFCTQDAVLENENVVGNLVKAFSDVSIGAAYARQLPNEDCKIIESYTRSFNYPEKSRIKGKEDLPELGIKTYFCSNVCAIYRTSIYRKLGGFITKTIFNEDMIMAAKMIQAGYKIAYVADARVIHSHNYSYVQQFRRNFDLAVSQADHPEIFEHVSSESEGIKLVKKTITYLVSEGKPWLIVDLFLTSGFKFLGYKLGRKYQKLPKKLVKNLSMNPGYWEET